MKVVFVLVSVVVLLLVDLDVASPTHKTNPNLNSIIHLAAKYNNTLHQEFFVEDLTKSGCDDDFFRKVYCILDAHKHILKDKDEKAIVRNLNVFINGSEVNCTALNPKNSVETVHITTLLVKLTRCCQKRNFHGQSP